MDKFKDTPIEDKPTLGLSVGEYEGFFRQAEKETDCKDPLGPSEMIVNMLGPCGGSAYSCGLRRLWSHGQYPCMLLDEKLNKTKEDLIWLRAVSSATIQDHWSAAVKDNCGRSNMSSGLLCQGVEHGVQHITRPRLDPSI
ncbi:Hypothetical predicted protein [Prunus dulcis]|uniref:Uncharacterized protein n=1 Tax=Prunus dulcis TaxID=3755 RepID=A0A5E4GB99_PRUDU|nr:hypothetical protein L3X38_018750 [Prunus dulcis]VVA37044.1 Hypothetical predicted protein [Prunus dulcis]